MTPNYRPSDILFSEVHYKVQSSGTLKQKGFKQYQGHCRDGALKSARHHLRDFTM